MVEQLNKLPKWVQDNSWSLPTLFRRAGMTGERIEGNFLIWDKKGTEYICRGMRDIHHVLAITEWQNKNPGWTLEQSVDLEISNLIANREESLLELGKINERIDRLNLWKKQQELKEGI